MAQNQVGFLLHLPHNPEDDHSIPKLPVVNGANVFGRDNFKPVSDKRLSRKHLTLVASPDGSAEVVVEGTNPVVVSVGGQRKKLGTGEKATIGHGDVIELIPGHHFYKYVAVDGSNKNKFSSNEGEELEGVAGLKPKRVRHDSKDEAFGTNLKSENKSNNQVGDSLESICNFIVPDDILPLTFRLLKVQSLPAWANTSSVSIGDVIKGKVLVAVLSNYMVDIDWLLSACPTLTKVPHVLVIHGEGDGTLEHMKRNKPANWILHKPPLPISYGTHHSKAMLLVYAQGVRIVVHTANLIYVDWNNKSQGLWMQDFPWKDQKYPSKGCGFENDLVDYLSALKWPEFSADIAALGKFDINPSFFKKFDYNSATVRLIASVPGYHTGLNLKKWGHMKLRNVLQECVFDKEFLKAPLVYQFSSLGSLDEKWMAELAFSMSSGISEDKTPLGLGEPLIIWPTVEDVRCSLEGYAAGNAIPSPQKNVEKEFLRKYWAKWKANHSGRCRAMPHIKTFVRYNGQNLAWMLLTSANLSKAAWGALQKNNSQLMIRSYELGVLFLPSLVKLHSHSFSCTDNGSSLSIMDKNGPIEDCEHQRTKLVTLTWQGNRNLDRSLVVPLPLPYELPPRQYSSEDVPWSWDRRYTKQDVYGQYWPRHVQLYASQD